MGNSTDSVTKHEEFSCGLFYASLQIQSHVLLSVGEKSLFLLRAKHTGAANQTDDITKAENAFLVNHNKPEGENKSALHCLKNYFKVQKKATVTT